MINPTPGFMFHRQPVVVCDTTRHERDGTMSAASRAGFIRRIAQRPAVWVTTVWSLSLAALITALAGSMWHSQNKNNGSASSLRIRVGKVAPCSQRLDVHDLRVDLDFQRLALNGR